MNIDINQNDKNLDARRDRFANLFIKNDSLYRYVSDHFVSNLKDISGLKIESAIDVCARNGYLIDALKKIDIKDLLFAETSKVFFDKSDFENKILYDRYNLSGAIQKKFDLLMAISCIHGVKRPEVAISDFANLLKKDGIIMLNVFGGQTLNELKQAFYHAESVLGSEIYQRFYPAIDIKSIGMLLQMHGFKNVVTSSEVISIKFKDFMNLISFVRCSGDAPSINKNKPIRRKVIELVTKDYQAKFCQNENHIIANFEIIYCFGIKAS